jgi:hypothetical protein
LVLGLNAVLIPQILAPILNSHTGYYDGLPTLDLFPILDFRVLAFYKTKQQPTTTSTMTTTRRTTQSE